MNQTKTRRIRRKNQINNQIKKFTGRMQAKLLLVFCIIILLLCVVLGRLVYLNYHKGERYSKRVLSQQTYVSNVIPYKRGSILDRKGTILAQSVRVFNLILDPHTVLEKKQYKEPTITALSGCYGFSIEELNQILAEKADSRYVVLKKELTFEERQVFLDAIKDSKNVKGVWFEEQYKRKYPLNTVACDVLGFTNSGNAGNWGIEQYYNEELNGSNGREYGYYDAELNLERIIKEAVNGNTIISTLDASVQKIVEKHITKFNQQTGAENTAVIVANPSNGEILAMASYPFFDLNNPRDLTPFYSQKEIKAMDDEETQTAWNNLWKNYCISYLYEPGSTFKPLSMSAAMDEAFIYDGEKFVCDGIEMVGGWPIKCVKRTGHGTITIKQAIMNSCNDVLMQIGYRLGKERLVIHQKEYGFGSKTGIDLPGEERGLTYQADNMDAAALATNMFGQNLSVTMIQMVAAFSSIINGGNYYQPHVVKEIVNDKGTTVKSFDKVLIKKTVSRETSDLMKDYLYATVEEGSGEKAKVAGYTIGGKTGTGEKQPRKTGKHIVSFMGFAPVENPQMIIYVVIDEPHVEEQNKCPDAVIMASDIMKEILPLLGIYPDKKKEKQDKKENQTDSEHPQTETDAADSETGESAGNPVSPAEPTANSENTSGQEEEPTDQENQTEEETEEEETGMIPSGAGDELFKEPSEEEGSGETE